MIIFDLDGTLADCEHRRHFVEPEKDPDVVHGVLPSERKGGLMFLVDYHKSTGKRWHPHFQKFYEACDLDKPIEPVIDILNHLARQGKRIEIWSGRCESVRGKTESWLVQNTVYSSKYDYNIKMRPVGDNTSDEALKEKWLNERCSDLIEAQIEARTPVKHDIEFVFDDRPKVVQMWRRRGIFVFDCNQNGKIF